MRASTDLDCRHYSHAVRWRNNRRACRFFSKAVAEDLASGAGNPVGQLQYPAEFQGWSSLAQAQFIEITVFLSQYLLSSQGDRVAMAHSVEGRYPFLDYRVVDLCSGMPDHLKLRALKDKYLLRRVAQNYLPAEIAQRPKRPYRAPIQRSFFAEGAGDYVRDLTSPAHLRATGLFEPASVDQLIRKADRGARLGESDEMALVGIISTQLLERQFISEFKPSAPLSAADKIKLVDRRLQVSGMRK